MGIRDFLRNNEPSPTQANVVSQLANQAAQGHGTAAVVGAAVFAAGTVAQSVAGTMGGPDPEVDYAEFTAPPTRLSDYSRRHEQK